jgi:cardiolipin synthase
LLLVSQGYFQSRKIRNFHINKLRDAKEKIWIQTPYFVPLSRIFRLLVKKVKEGADVRIIVPRENDVWLTQWMSYSYLFALVKAGVEVYEYTPRFAHEKVFIIDDWMCLGSSNLNHRSFIHDLEMDIVITHEDNKRDLLEDFLRCQRQSQEFSMDVYSSLSLRKRLFSQLLTVFSYWS